MTNRTAALRGLTLGLGILVCSCGVRRAAIVVYSPMKGSVLGAIAREFERQTGTRVELFYGGSGEILSRIRAERDQPRGSVWIGAGGFIPFLVAKREGLLERYRPQHFEEDLAAVPPAIVTHDADWSYVGAYVLALGWTYDPARTQAAALPQDFIGLLEPRWHHQIEMADPASSGTSALFLEAAIQGFIAQGRGEDAGWAYLRSLASAILRFPESGGAPAVDVGKGEVALGLSFDQQAYLARSQGASVRFALPRQTPILIDPAALIKGGPNPADAHRFIDFFLSRPAQEIIRTEGYFSLRKDVEPPLGSPYSLQDYGGHAMPLDLDWMANNFDRVRRTWREQIVPSARD
ncbi:MAG TPA: extracellular solute-binding protein [Vicinamibacterales bacterium]|nr:extracellular solute-binding protein [Vicinamibacterales bacterium]